MSNEIEITLSNGTKFTINPENPKALFEEIIKNLLIPFYKDTNDWNESIRSAINAMDYIRKTVKDLPTMNYRELLLKEIKDKLGNEIENIEGVDKIEILFLNMDDYTEEIHTIMTAADLDRENKVRSVGDLIAGLNGFEMSELMYHYLKKVYGIKE